MGFQRRVRSHTSHPLTPRSLKLTSALSPRGRGGEGESANGETAMSAKPSLVGTLPLLLAMAGILLPAAAGAEEAAAPELDIAVTSKLNASPEYCAECAAKLCHEAGCCFRGLNAVPAPEKPKTAARPPAGATPPPPDEKAAAKYRLQIDHSGSITLGNITSTLLQYPDSHSSTIVPVAMRTWFMDAQCKATLQFSLLRRDGVKYTVLDKWSAPAPKGESAPAGTQVEIARFTGVANKVGGAQLPISPEEAAKTAQRAFLPGNPSSLILSHLFSIAAAAAPKPANGDPVPEGLTLEITIENKSPWPVKEIEAVLSWQGKPHALGEMGKAGGYHVLVLPEPLPPGQKTTVVTAARPQTPRPGPGVYDAAFVLAEKEN